MLSTLSLSPKLNYEFISALHGMKETLRKVHILNQCILLLLRSCMSWLHKG